MSRCLREAAASRGYAVTSAPARSEDALLLASSGSFDAAVVGDDGGRACALDLIQKLKAQNPALPVVAAVASGPLAAGPPGLAAVDLQRLFAELEQALEPRQTDLSNRRLVWELQVFNEISDAVSRALDLDEMLTGALQRLIASLGAVGGAIRLHDGLTGRFETKAVTKSPEVARLWDFAAAQFLKLSDDVIASRGAVIVEEFAQRITDQRNGPVPVRSAIGVPMFGKHDVLGTLVIGAASPGRFELADERLLATIAGQIAIAVQKTQLHESVRRGKREWEQTFDAISDPIAVFDGRGTLLRGNTALATLLGTPVTDLRHKSCREIGLCGTTCPSCSVGEALARGAAGRAEITLPNGQIFSVTTFPVGAVSDGVSVVQVAKNVTDEIRSARRLRLMSEELSQANARLIAAVGQLKSAQAQLLQAEKLSAIGQLVAGVAHELNNPLTSVIGYAQLLEQEMLDANRPDDLRPPAELAIDLRCIAQESERAARIVRDLLAFARQQTAARAPHDITELATRVLSLRAYEHRLSNIEVRTDFQLDLPPVVADASQLQQAVLNLILNAEQAMRGRAVRRLSIGTRFDAASAAVELIISDTGHGIDDANLSRIFDPFFTTRDVGEGTGLGLSICYGIVRDHGGQITVKSKALTGSIFSVVLPARVEDLAPAEILVAHAEQSDRDYLTAALNAWGYTAVHASRSDEALARYRDGSLHALLIDRSVLATDLAAWSAARRGDERRVPLILTSMAADDDDIERFGREQACAVLAPPFQLRALWTAARMIAKEYI
jgi:two-component system NtrC family sensor kinase